MATTPIAVDRFRSFSPVALSPVDDFTGRAPVGRIGLVLDVEDGAGGWVQTDIAPVVTPSSVYAYPGLGLVDVVANHMPRWYRVRVYAEHYRPLYLRNVDGIEFQVDPFSVTTPPAGYARSPSPVALVPALGYAFEAHVPVIRGQVRDGTGAPVENALVAESNNERTLTDARGAFALPLRWVVPGTPTTIDATDDRTGHTGQITVTLPAALGQSQAISIS